jgi:hypothetical protein
VQLAARALARGLAEHATAAVGVVGAQQEIELVFEMVSREDPDSILSTFSPLLISILISPPGLSRLEASINPTTRKRMMPVKTVTLVRIYVNAFSTFDS